MLAEAQDRLVCTTRTAQVPKYLLKNADSSQQKQHLGYHSTVEIDFKF